MRHRISLFVGLVVVGCSDPPDDPPADVPIGAPVADAAAPGDPGKGAVDGGFAAPDGGVLAADRFVTQVVSFTPGDCGGYGIPKMPGVVLGPPVGGGDVKGGLDVVSLGVGGEIVLGFAPNAIVDGPGVDFLVFENAFYAGGDPARPAADLAEVSVSEDGVTWKAFPCTPGAAPPFGTCAGWRPVYATPGGDVSPVDPLRAGGDPYDLAALGVARARFVRIRDRSALVCPSDPAKKPVNYGFDLDAIAIVNADRN